MTHCIKGRQGDPIDMHLGAKLREIRLHFKLSQRELAEILGVKHQQIGKYEHGLAAMSASALGLIAEELDFPVGVFFCGLPQPAPTSLVWWEKLDPTIRKAAIDHYQPAQVSDCNATRCDRIATASSRPTPSLEVGAGIYEN